MSYLSKYIIFFIITTSCSSQEGQVSIKPAETGQKLKFEIGKKKADSTLIGLFIPQRIEIVNSFSDPINFSNSYRSISGGNIQDDFIYLTNSDTITGRWQSYKIGAKDSEFIDLYAGFRIHISNNELDLFLATGKISQKRLERVIYDINEISNLEDFLDRYIPNNLKGYIHLNYTNPKTGQFDYLNIPIRF